MLRYPLLSNALSAVLFVVAVVGIVVQVHEIHDGIVFAQTRLVIVAYVVIALYALVSIWLRLRAARGRR